MNPMIAASWMAFCATAGAVSAGEKPASAINRDALVARHNPVLTKVNALSPFSVGNGEFAFTADVTGLQTFPDIYEKGMPLHIESQWGWHTAQNPDGYLRTDAIRTYDIAGRSVPY